jgi:membrane protease YdiL (CAAX protease family)
MFLIKKLTDWIKCHQIAAFFIITFMITWGIGGFAIFLPEQFRAIFGEISDKHPLYYIAVASPTISASILTLGLEGWQGLGHLFKRLIRWRFAIHWYVLVILGLPLSSWLITLLTGSHPLKDISSPVLLFTFLLNLLITGPLGEELGWRGYALPRLLAWLSPFTAALILGIIWGVWHLPSFYVSAMVQFGVSIPLFLLNAICLSFLACWFFIKTGGSVLITVLLHYFANFCLSVLGVPTLAFTMLTLAAALAMVALDKRFAWFKKPILLENRS